MERREQSKRGNGKLKMEEKKKKQRVKWGENVGEWGGERERWDGERVWVLCR